jgi:carbonic anhydrase/acetyltransferase-like protein (isoleucine patch superfamily)
MALVLPVRNFSPQIDAGVWLAPNATVVGDVHLGPGCTVWFNAVVRGDVHQIRIGEDTNIQDGAVLHCTYEKADLQIGNRVSIAHQATVHGCRIEDEVLIGIGAIILDHAHIQQNCFIAAGALITPGMVCEAGGLYAGAPAKRLKDVTQEQVEIILKTAERYKMYAGWYGVD